MAADPLVVFRGKSPGLPRPAIRAFATELQRRVAGGRPFCALVTGDTQLRQLNRDFRGKDTPTDVLSFPSATPEGGLGDIAISVDRAAEQARAIGHDLATEVRILMLHGVLHLLGHDHETDRGAMKRLETRWRRELNLPGGLIERTRGKS